MIRWLIHVRTEFVGFHSWPEAPKHLSYLADTHRHKFFVQATVEVTEGDRQLEFHEVKEALDEMIGTLKLRGPHTDSCEVMAEQLIGELVEEYGGHRHYRVAVWEDNENGGEAIWTVV